MQSPISFERYAEAQRRRLEEIRRTTEKERELLRVHTMRKSLAADYESMNTKDAGTAAFSPVDSSWPVGSGAGFSKAGLHVQSIDEVIRGAGGNPIANSTRWSTLNERAAQLHELDKKLSGDDEKLDRDEFALQRRFAKAEGHKKDLLTHLSVLQHQEADQQAREVALEKEEKIALQRHEEVVARGKAESSVLVTINKDRSERQARLGEARRKVDEKRSQQESIASALRQQAHDLEVRVKALEQEVKSQERHIGDMELLLKQDEMRVRDGEVDHIRALQQMVQSIQSLQGLRTAKHVRDRTF